jgi:hypothetical protein
MPKKLRLYYSRFRYDARKTTGNTPRAVFVQPEIRDGHIVLLCRKLSWSKELKLPVVYFVIHARTRARAHTHTHTHSHTHARAHTPTNPPTHTHTHKHIFTFKDWLYPTQTVQDSQILGYRVIKQSCGNHAHRKTRRH